MILYTAGDPAALAEPLRSAVRAQGEDVPVYDLRSMRDTFEGAALIFPRLMALPVGMMGLIGLSLAALAFPFVLWWRGDPDVAIAVALSLLAACSVASVVAMALPALFRRAGVDPAFGSGPLATVVQDLLSILLYLWIATAIV